MSLSRPDLIRDDVLDNPAWHSLTGVHAALAEGSGLGRRYRPDVSIFAGVSDPHDPQAWRDLADVVGPGGTVLITGAGGVCSEGWEMVSGGEGVQLVDTPRVVGSQDPEAVVLGDADVPEMLDLVARTEPGPFGKSTHTMGTYLGLRHEGRLVAMTGQRMHPDGWVEISAVCTAPEARGRGLASRLVRAVTADIHARGRRALMHAAVDNTSAISVYERLGFEVRRRTTFELFRAPS
ncbi:ribosomal protein S18 acetylase RimI-like enzyme [Nocardioides luteus]|uniref:GNAT family N-acetyltransferase n=1 Tax=Nocardioides luteus TaxID=1844 RepID=A0ABQ5T151_9ACTN|nr:GNAT family N-acetyltransferase [Nocardioides luteus]MDR7311546.1 ribosomal protein S18 acetylase RimI-like enzyme [Nocardioides luteus]GGR54848.1 GNAT family N-acetyltransferase [Nocardioides luteus]GLJ70195.1 GNAT family N-acetyltransferase [Nocardioides luteus]